MVNEITPDGNVVHLTDDSIPKPKYKEASTEAVEEISHPIASEKPPAAHDITTIVNSVP